MNTDLNAEILSALSAHDTIITDAAPATPSALAADMDEQKRYLRRHIGSVTVDDRRAICRVIVDSGCKNLLRTCAEGVLVCMDKLPDAVIAQMYNVLYYTRTRE